MTLMQKCYPPCTVFFAPMADSAPIEPTMKYWKTLLPVSPVLERYFFQALVGMLVVLEPLKGLSKEADETGRFCTAVAAAARTAGNCERTAVLASELAVVVSAGMVGEQRGGRRWMEAGCAEDGDATLEVEVQWCQWQEVAISPGRALIEQPLIGRSARTQQKRLRLGQNPAKPTSSLLNSTLADDRSARQDNLRLLLQAETSSQADPPSILKSRLYHFTSLADCNKDAAQDSLSTGQRI